MIDIMSSRLANLIIYSINRIKNGNDKLMYKERILSRKRDELYIEQKYVDHIN